MDSQPPEPLDARIDNSNSIPPESVINMLHVTESHMLTAKYIEIVRKGDVDPVYIAKNMGELYMAKPKENSTFGFCLVPVERDGAYLILERLFHRAEDEVISVGKLSYRRTEVTNVMDAFSSFGRAPDF